MTKVIDNILDLMSSLGIEIKDLEQRVAQLQSDSNENEINNKIIDSDSLDPSATVALQDQMPATAAAAVKEAKKERSCLKSISPARLWQDFVAFNRIKGRSGYIHLKAFLGFLRVWENRLDKPKKPTGTRAHTLTSVLVSNREFHRLALERFWGPDTYRSHIDQTVRDRKTNKFQATLLVHEEAIRRGFITV